VIYIYLQNAKRHKGFTLIELMVVVGIISIVGMIVSPGIKKIYEDLKMDKTANEVVSLMNSCRSYYLIFNEIPKDYDPGKMPKTLKEFVPSSFFNKTLYDNAYYTLNIVPFGGTNYDVDNWLHDNKAALITMYFKTAKDRVKMKTKLDKIFQPDDFKLWQWNGAYELGIFFQEVTGCNENRYY